MQVVPRHAPEWDATLALLRDPYRHIGRTAESLGTPVFAGRLLARRANFMVGSDAARLFCDPERFERAGAAPEPLRATLFGRGGVQGLDGAAHRHRKAIFLGATRVPQLERLAGLFRAAWRRQVLEAPPEQPVPMAELVRPALAAAVCHWTGVPLARTEQQRRARELAWLFDAVLTNPRRHLRARWARWQAERWLARLVVRQRQACGVFPADSVAAAITHWREPDGRPLPARIAAVELLNLLRPTVADRDPAAWASPLVFRPERWMGGPADAYAFVPQGPGDVRVHHRCPGEDLAARLMREALDVLPQRLRYRVPPQDLRLSMERLPALPRDGFRVSALRWAD